MLFKKTLTYSEKDFDAVIAGCIAGDNQAQRFLFKKFFGYSKSICVRYTSFTEDAEEVLSEGFLKVFNNLQSYDPAYPFKAWLRTIMINTAISYNRKHKKHTEYRIGLEETHDLGFDEEILSEITAEEILELIQQLRPAYRNVFLMHAVDGYNHREIAAMLEINEATIRSQYIRARAKLQILIKEHYPHLVAEDYSNGSVQQNYG